MIRLLPILLLVLSPIFSFAQSHSHTEKCGTTIMMNKRFEAHPELKAKRAKAQQLAKNWMNQPQQFKTQAVITIPVVVHVLYKNAAQNISDAQIQSQIDVLNADFRKMNTDFLFSTPAAFRPFAADCEIEFCLAKIDPDGNNHTGITRTSVANNFSISDDYYRSSNGGKAPWDNTKYMNIWVGNLTNVGLLGFATPPGSTFGNGDGMVVDDQAFGTVGTAATNQPNDMGRTATHEVGHYFNLEHVWGNNGGCVDDDFAADTPSQDGPTWGCPTFPVTDVCSSSGNGVMYCNYMDYCDDACLTMFTSDQKTIMLAAINTSRSGLIANSFCSGVSLVEERAASINLYPNPTEESIIIDGTNFNTEGDKYYITNSIGMIVGAGIISNSEHRIDVSAYSTGVYYFTIYHGEESFKQSFVKK